VRATLLWFGLLGAPAAWVLELVAGYGVEETACSEGTSQWDLNAGLAHGLVFGITAALALGAGAAAVWSWQNATPDVRGRVAWMGYSAVLISVLFIALVLMTGFGVTSLESCER
jgi:hypothetical protein